MINHELRITNYEGYRFFGMGLFVVPLFFLLQFFLRAASPPPPPPPPPVQLGPESYVVANVEQIESGPVISGTLVPRDQAVVRAQIAGSVLARCVDQGSPVRAGEVIATIDNSALTDAVTSAKNGVTNAESALDVARREQSGRKRC